MHESVADGGGRSWPEDPDVIGEEESVDGIVVVPPSESPVLDVAAAEALLNSSSAIFHSDHPSSPT
ncbi:hypothetical protein [Nocardia gipuzkoensis]